MQLRLLVLVLLQRSPLAVFCIALTTCQTHRVNSGPSIEFTHFPPAVQGGRERVDDLGTGKERSTKAADWLFMHTVGRGRCSPGRLTSNRDGDR